MLPAQIATSAARSSVRSAGSRRGFTLIEVIMAMLVGLILTAIAIPQVKSAVYSYRLNSAVSMAQWAIQSTRFQALQQGYPYQVVFTASTMSYQIQNLPSGSTYVNVGSPVPLSAWTMTFSQNTTINFKPNGMVTATVGSNVFTITYQGTTHTITVSNYGNVTVQ